MMGASQRHKCEIHGFTVIGDGTCPPYGGGGGEAPTAMELAAMMQSSMPFTPPQPPQTPPQQPDPGP